MESLGRLTGGVAHDFNNLLTVVLGNAAALRVNAEARGDAEAIRRAEMIERAAERGGRLAAQLLAYSRKQMLRPETISVYQIISATSELLAQAAGEAVRIRLRPNQSFGSAMSIRGSLNSAILNLVLNARDAMPVGGNITIHCYNHTVRRGQPGTPARGCRRLRADRRQGYRMRDRTRLAGQSFRAVLHDQAAWTGQRAWSFAGLWIRWPIRGLGRFGQQASAVARPYRCSCRATGGVSPTRRRKQTVLRLSGKIRRCWLSNPIPTFALRPAKP